jgi:hypothetical protein
MSDEPLNEVPTIVEARRRVRLRALTSKDLEEALARVYNDVDPREKQFQRLIRDLILPESA